MRHLTRRRVLVVLLELLSALALVLFGRSLNATKRGGQEPAEPFRIAGNLYYADPFIDPGGYRAHIDTAEAEFRRGVVH